MKYTDFNTWFCDSLAQEKKSFCKFDCKVNRWDEFDSSLTPSLTNRDCMYQQK